MAVYESKDRLKELVQFPASAGQLRRYHTAPPNVRPEEVTYSKSTDFGRNICIYLCITFGSTSLYHSDTTHTLTARFAL